jgi:hypothetical protein
MPSSAENASIRKGSRAQSRNSAPVTQCSLVQRTSERERKKHIGGANADRRRNHAYKNQRVALPCLHIAGVTGSSPVPPTIKFNNLILARTVSFGTTVPEEDRTSTSCSFDQLPPFLKTDRLTDTKLKRDGTIGRPESLSVLVTSRTPKQVVDQIDCDTLRPRPYPSLTRALARARRTSMLLAFDRQPATATPWLRSSKLAQEIC